MGDTKNIAFIWIAGLAVTTAVIIALAITVLLYRNTEVNNGAGPATVVVQMLEGPECDAMVPTADFWNQHYATATGTRIQVVALDRTGYFDKLEMQLIAGESTPDIIHPFSIHLARIRPYLEPLEPFLQDQAIMTDPDGKALSLDAVLPVAMDTVRSEDGKIYMLPTDMSEVLLFYRQDLIKTPPGTWDDFVRLAKRYTRTINPDSPTQYGIVLQGKYETWAFCSALENILPYGIDPFNVSSEDDINLLTKSLQPFEDLAAAKAFPPETVNAEYSKVAAMIKSGEVAMALQWNAFYQDLRNPESSPKVYDKVDVAPPPGIRQEDGTIKRSLYVHTINLALNRHSRHKQKAMMFMTWATLGEGAWVYARAGGSSPLAEIWDNDKISDLYPRLAPWLAAHGQSPTPHKQLTKMMMAGSGWIQRMIAGDLTVEQAAQGIAAEMKRLRSSEPEADR